jgi:type III pantothenate kinase
VSPAPKSRAASAAPARSAKSARGDYRLAVDVGNTQTVLGLFDGAKILKRWRLATRKDITVDEISLALKGLAEQPLRGRVRAAALASVVPAQDGPWTAALGEVFAVVPRVLDHRDCGGLRLDYEIPSQIGADRLANVLGARSLGVREGIVVDFGTATTFDIFSGDTYFGGVICPGLQSGLRALTQNAAKISDTELRWPARVTGRTTDEALRSGILAGAVGSVEYLIDEILAEREMRKPEILATGGLAHWLEGRAPSLRRFEPDLTLIGINHLLSKAPPRQAGARAEDPA